MSPFLGEFIGTALLIILGDGVVANVVLSKTKGNNSGWIVITFGWGMAVFTGVFASTHLGGSGHLNPAVTLAVAWFADFDWNNVLPYIAAQFAGAFTGAVIVWVAYKKHFDETADADAKLAVFCTGPAIRSVGYNLITEIIGTFILVMGASLMSKPEIKMGTLEALPVGLLVLAIGLSLGGPTGYAINPARDLGPRIAHFYCQYPVNETVTGVISWIPVTGPVIGGLGCLGFRML
jgi:glycerol uptake facilitator protein